MKSATNPATASNAPGALPALVRALFDSPHLFICLLDREGRLIDANARAAEFGGFAACHFNGMYAWRTPWWSRCPHSRQALVNAIPQALGGAVVRFSGEWVGAQQEIAYIDFSLRPIRDDTGTATQLLLEGLNVTAQRCAEEALQDQFALLDGFFQSAPVGMVILDRDLRHQNINPTLAAINGLPVPAHVGRTLREIVPQVAPQLEPVLERILRSGEPALNIPVSGALASTPGITRHWITSHFPIRDSLGKTHGIGGVVVEVTDTVRAEAAVRTQKALIDGFFRAAPVGMAIMDRDLRYLHINEALAASNGLPSAAHTGRTLDEVIPELSEPVGALYRLVLERQEGIYNLPLSGRIAGAPDATQHWSVSLFPIADGDNAAAFLGSVVVDVSERMQAEQALHAKVVELGEAQRLARVGSWEWCPESDSLYWSEETFRIFGLPPEKPAPQRDELAALFRAEGWQPWREGFKRLLAGEGTCASDLKVPLPDGACRWMIVRGEAERDDSGRLLKVRGTVQDITERKQAEIATRELAREVTDLYQNAPCGYHSIDTGGCIVRINDTELDWLGYSRDELLGRKITDILTPASQRVFSTCFPLLQLRGRLNNIEYEMVRKDGSLLPVLLNATAIFDAQGHYIVSRSTVTDMTEKKRQAEERRQQEEHRLEISRHMINLQEEERRGLALEVHDVVSPNLAAVLINLGIIEAGLTQQAMKYLGVRLGEVRQLVQETNLSLRRICANLRPSALDYAGLQAAVDTYIRQFAARTGLEIEFIDGGIDGRLPGDVEILLFRIVQEALANCAKHAQASRVTVELNHERKHACLVISDNGVGFDPEALSTAARKPGLGLLTMAERAEFAGGTFRLESSPGRGTRISVEI